MAINETACKGGFILLRAVDPDTVCCEPSLLVCALRSAGVELHPAFPFQIKTVGEKVIWEWFLADCSKDGIYATADLIRWWNDPAWLAAHPTHEWTIARAALMNMAIQAGEIRNTIPRVVVRNGNSAAHIPVNASPARRQWLLDRLHGHIPLNTPFKEPSETAAA